MFLTLLKRFFSSRRFQIYLSILILALTSSACRSKSPVQKVGSLDTGTAYRVFIQEDTAFVSTNDGVVLVDIQDRNHPKEISRINLEEAAFGVYAQDNLVFAAGPADGLVIADIQDPTSPQVIGKYQGNGINEVCVQGQVAYAGTQNGDLYLINIKNPAKPSLISTYHGQGGMGLMVACQQDVVYFSLSGKGLDVLDVSDSTRPVKTLTVPNTQGAKDLQIVSDWLYLACAGNGVRILNIENHFFPYTVTSFNHGGEVWGIGGDTQVLWVGDLKEGIKIYTMNDPQALILIAQNGNYAPHDIFYDGTYAYLADQDQGFVILQYNENG